MAAIAIAAAFLVMLTCAGAQAPAPAPLRQRTPVPVTQSSPTPAPTQEATPGPTAYMSPPEGSPGLAPLPPCYTQLLNVSDCLTYVTKGSNLTTPDKGCCPALAGLVDSSPICLCELFAQAKNYGIDLDMSKALKLPSVCQVPTPPLSTCAMLGIPVGAPATSNMPGMSPSGPPSSEMASPPESSKGSSRSSRSSLVAVFLTGLWGVIALML